MSKPSALPQTRTTTEIGFEQWTPFLDEFTRQNRGAHARLDILGPDVGYQVETENRPLDGVAADVKDGERSVWIMFADVAGGQLTHGVQEVSALRYLPPTAQKGAVLEIERRDGTITLLEVTNPDTYELPPASESVHGQQRDTIAR
jgi:hypothetical protein